MSEHPHASPTPARMNRTRSALLCVLLLSAAMTVAHTAIAQPTIYWSNTYSGSLQRTVVGSGSIDELLEGFVDRPHSLRVDPDEGKLYWALDVDSPSPNNAILQRSDLDGFNLENLVLSASCAPYCPVSAMTIDTANDSLYWFTWDGEFTDKAVHNLYRSGLDGSGIMLLGGSDNVVMDVVIDVENQQMYWLDGKWPVVLADHAIMRSTLGGSGLEQILLVFDGKPPEEGNLAVDTAGGKVYWVTQNRAIRRANMEGSEVEDLVSIEGDSDSTRFGDLILDVANSKMYWSVTYGGISTFPVGVIHRANLDGSDVETLLSLSPGSIGAFAVDLSGTVANEPTDIAASTALGAPWPNPAASSVSIPYSLELPQSVTISLYDVLGRRVRQIARGFQSAGEHRLDLPTNDLPSGLYLLRLEGRSVTVSRAFTVRR